MIAFNHLPHLKQRGTLNGRSHQIYWLTYVRIREAALLCAGNYADNGEYQAAGDLLVNPQ